MNRQEKKLNQDVKDYIKEHLEDIICKYRKETIHVLEEKGYMVIDEEEYYGELITPNNYTEDY